jgi:hypothetical protein
MTRPGGFVESFGKRYVSSNVLLSKTQHPLGFRYRVLQGRKHKVLSFGFLYDMHDHDPAVSVENVETVVVSDWFKKALKEEEYDAILVLAHMDVKDHLVTVILTAIRSELNEDASKDPVVTPVQFLTGHTHYRGHFHTDAVSSSFEAGRFLDTVGFCSFPTRATLASALAEYSQHSHSTASNQTSLHGGAEQNTTCQPRQNTTDDNVAESPNTPPKGQHLQEQVGTNETMQHPLLEPDNADSREDVYVPGSNGGTRNRRTANAMPISPSNHTAGAVSAHHTGNGTAHLFNASAHRANFTQSLFKHVFIDTNVDVLTTTLGVPELLTENGDDLSNLIVRIQSGTCVKAETTRLHECVSSNAYFLRPSRSWAR